MSAALWMYFWNPASWGGGGGGGGATIDEPPIAQRLVPVPGIIGVPLSVLAAMIAFLGRLL